jgi:hypothetical protein
MSEKSGLLNRLMDNMTEASKSRDKGASFIENNTRKQGPIEKAYKLRELGKMIRRH